MAPGDEVRRPRLETVLDAEWQVVVVTAPPGYGKSTLVAGWARRSPQHRVAWVSLDPFDRSALSFWRYVTASISRLLPAALEPEAILLEHGQPGPEFAAALAHTLWEDRRPLVLVIDDLQWADAATVHDVLGPLVESCRGVLRLVAIGRSDPPLPTHRWRTEGRAVEIRMSDLAFEHDEAASLMRRFDIDALGQRDVERLNEHVEGWAVGLLLSGLTLEGRPDLAQHLDDLIQSDRHLTDYLVDEVLDRLPDDLRELALVLSVTTRFDEELARLLTGRSDAGSLLDRLVRSNPFVVGTVSPPAYRFHHLLRSLLSTTFRWNDVAAFERAHRVNAAVMLERGHTAEAIASLLEIGAVDEAFDIVTLPVLHTADQGRMRELRQWLDMLGDVQTADPARALSYALALAIAGRTEDALVWTERAAELADPADARLALTTAITRVTALAAAGSLDEAARELPRFDAVQGDAHESSLLDSRMSVQLTRIALAAGDLARAERWLPHLSRHPEPVVAQVVAPAMRSWLHTQRGDIGRALDDAVEACTSAERLEVRPHFSSHDALLARGWAEALAARSPDLANTLEALAEDADAIEQPFFLLRLWPLRVMEQALEAGWPAALELTRTLDPGAYPGRGGRLATCHDELRALALLDCGLEGEAAPIVESLPAGTTRSLLTARGLMVGGRHDGIEVALAGHESWLIPQRLEALMILAETRLGADGRSTMTQALELGRTSGLVAPFVLEGRRLHRLLEDLPVDELFPALAGRLRPAATPAGARRPVDIVEPLTAKELAVLARLPSHETYRAIAAHLYVSVNTVKTYVRSIYRKLGASSRAEAVEVARQCGLLDR